MASPTLTRLPVRHNLDNESDCHAPLNPPQILDTLPRFNCLGITCRFFPEGSKSPIRLINHGRLSTPTNTAQTLAMAILLDTNPAVSENRNGPRGLATSHSLFQFPERKKRASGMIVVVIPNKIKAITPRVGTGDSVRQKSVFLSVTRPTHN